MAEAFLEKRVLIADDDPGIRMLLEAICDQIGLQTRTVGDGKAIVQTVTEWGPDLILMDAMMPSQDGFHTTLELKQTPAFERIPIIMLTGLKSREDRLKGIRAGADDFLTKPIDSEELKLRVQNHLKIKEFGDFLSTHNETLERQVAERTERIRESHIDTIFRLAVASEYKDEETGGHIRRISDYAARLAREVGRDAEFCETIFHAASMHDIGKVGIPDRVMQKEGRLEEREWRTMKSHTTLGARILSGSNSPYLRMGEEIALSHHERWDGSGYPNGLSGEQIPVTARITAIADQYDALRSRRPYKSAFSHAKTCEIIIRGDGRTKPEHFDPSLHSAFKRCAPEFQRIFDENVDPDIDSSGKALEG